MSKSNVVQSKELVFRKANKAGKTPKLWRFEEEVAYHGETFKKITPDVSKNISEFFGLSDPKKTPDGYNIIGIRERGWRRPFVIEKSGKKFLVSERGLKNHT